MLIKIFVLIGLIAVVVPAKADNPIAPQGTSADLICWFEGKQYSWGAIIKQADPMDAANVDFYVCGEYVTTIGDGPNAPKSVHGAWVKLNP